MRHRSLGLRMSYLCLIERNQEVLENTGGLCNTTCLWKFLSAFRDGHSHARAEGAYTCMPFATPGALSVSEDTEQHSVES